ncbi:MAG: hypothetical protein Q9217_004282 [Psora testacea]
MPDMPRQSSRTKQTLTSNASISSRPRRAASGVAHATITRDEPESSDESKPALRLTVKMPSSRLREATSAQAEPEDTAPPARSTRNKQRKSYALESDSEEVDDIDDEEEEEEDEAEMSEISDLEGERQQGQAGTTTPGGGFAEDDDQDEESDQGDDGNADDGGDLDMEDDDADDGLPLGASAPAHAPILKLKGPALSQQPQVTVTPAQDNKVKSVEAKEMEMEDDDEELSELASVDDEEEDVEEDAEGEEDVEEMDEGDESRSPDAVDSRASTPDVSKMTKRQRSRLDQVMGGHFLQLPMEPQIKKHLTAEEHAMRRAEMARRRKNLSEKRNEEEKADTINRLLKKQAPKRRGKISQAEIAAQDRGDDEDEEVGEVEEEVRPANPIFVRWVSMKEGCKVGVPAEWLGAPVGRVFGGVGNGKIIEEVEG